MLTTCLQSRLAWKQQGKANVAADLHHVLCPRPHYSDLLVAELANSLFLLGLPPTANFT